MYIPMNRTASTTRKTPAWLELQAGEQFVRSWGRACCGKSGNKSTVASSIVIAMSTVFAGQAGFLDFKMFDEGGQPTSTRWILIGVFALSMLVAVGVVIWVLVRRGSLRAALTDRRIIFREKRNETVIALRDITQLRAVDSGREQLVQFHARRHRGPVASLPVSDPAAVIAQIEELAIEAGAELKQ